MLSRSREVLLIAGLVFQNTCRTELPGDPHASGSLRVGATVGCTSVGRPRILEGNPRQAFPDPTPRRLREARNVSAGQALVAAKKCEAGEQGGRDRHDQRQNCHPPIGDGQTRFYGALCEVHVRRELVIQ